ncbi:MAG: hypothetical protein AMJ65_17905, partial [Phycisphaerae bacterium SG8_4]
IIVGAYILVSDLGLWRIVKRDRPLMNGDMLELFEECKTQMDIQSLLVVVPSSHVRSPGLFGFVRPRLLLPKEMIESANREEMQYVFLHELAHLKRHDIYLGWLTSLLQILHWFNPLVWFAFYRMRTDRELACDALVLTRTGQDKSQEYGGAILGLVRRFSRSRPLPAIAGIMENRSQLKRRIAMITQFTSNSYRWSPLAVIFIVVLACISLPNGKRTRASETNPAMPVSAMTVRRVGYEWRGPFANLSPDGTYMSDRDWETGALVIRELATGKSRILVSGGSDETGSPLVSAVSPDSKEVAYLRHDPKKNASSLNIVSLDGEDHRVLCEGKWLMPRDWSSDGKKILAVVEENDIWQMVWISASDGSLEHIVPVGTSYPGKLDVSPDGRFIAYDCRQPEDTSKRDVFVFDLRENRELSIINHPADDRFLGWTPDGKHMFFISDRTGTWDAWLLTVANGKPQGFPKLTRHGIGNITPIGFTPQGSYYYGHEQTLEDVFVAKLDLETGEFLSEPMPVRQSGATGCHDWSPDGQYLAYCERHSDESQAVHIRTLSTGRERTLSGNLPNIRWLRWSPDMRSILTDGYKRGDSQGAISKIDVKTGERSDIVRSKTDVLLRPEMSPDGKTLFYERSSDPMSKTSRLIARHLESGREKELVRVVPPARLTNRALSPDGQRFVLSIVPDPTRPLAPVLKILPVAGGEPEELIQFDKSENLRAVGVAWTPDSRNVLFWKWCFPADKELELWRISAGGGEPRRLCSRKAFGHLRVHPDGQRVAFHDRSTTRGLWVMENFLPTMVASEPSNQPKFTKIRIPTKPQNGVLSPDGSKLAFMSDGAVWVVPLHGKVDPDIAGEPVRLAELPGILEASGMIAWSADGKWIAVYRRSDEEVGVCVIPVAGGKPRVVQLPEQGGHLWGKRLSLSPDGRMLAFSALELGKPREEVSDSCDRRIYTIPTAGGKPKQVSSDWARLPSFSPDGQFIAYVGYSKREGWPDNTKASPNNGDLWVAPSGEGTPLKLATVDRRLRGPVWSPDGRYIAAHHEPGSANHSKEIWVFPLSSDVSSAGEPEKIALPGLSMNMLAGWTPDNELGVFIQTEEHCAIYTVPASGGEAVQISPAGAWPYYPRWSPDGERIYCRGGYVPAVGSNFVEVAMQSERRLVSRVPGGSHNISPNGKRIVVSAYQEPYDPKEGVDVWTIPLDDGLAVRLTSDQSSECYPCWSPDGEWIAFVDHRVTSEQDGLDAIYVVSAEGGEARQLTSVADNVDSGAIAFSPDGERIAFFSDGSIKTIPVEGGEPEALVTEVKSHTHSQLAYSPDGSKIAHNASGKIWITLLGRGKPEELRTGLPDNTKLSEFGWSPDGEKIAFMGSTGDEAEFWLIEDFLPKDLGK